VIEMFVDWYCAGKRHNTGNIRHSIEKNKARFGFDEELEQLFINTIDILDIKLFINTIENSEK